MNGISSWLVEASPEQKRTLLAASLGWMLDSMDVMLYALVLGQVQRELHLSAAMSGAMMSATLVSAAAGGLGFGWFADRFGRTRALTCSILIYSVATAMCAAPAFIMPSTDARTPRTAATSRPSESRADGSA